MEKKNFVVPVIISTKAVVQPIVCKKAACSGGSVHVITKMKVRVEEKQKVA